MTYPYRGDSPLVQARRLAHAYRGALLLADQPACQRLDKLAEAWGLTWAVPRAVAYDPDEWLPPADAASVACISTDTLRQLRKRGRITGRKSKNGWEYKVADLWKLAHQPRGRGPGVTDTLHTSGTTVPTDAQHDGS
jgi:hypothetical protein